MRPPSPYRRLAQRDVLARQARFAADAMVLEIVKGGADEGETPLACAQRELREELGFEARTWRPLGITYEIPSIVQNPVTLAAFLRYRR